jgi:hypothetical protein
MKREEEIAKYCEDMGFTLGSCSSINSVKVLTASDAIKWADETMIERACDWLDKVNTDNYMDSGIFQMNELIIDFKKAMKGE